MKKLFLIVLWAVQSIQDAWFDLTYSPSYDDEDPI